MFSHLENKCHNLQLENVNSKYDSELDRKCSLRSPVKRHISRIISIWKNPLTNNLFQPIFQTISLDLRQNPDYHIKQLLRKYFC
jgi:hypothetical protein